MALVRDKSTQALIAHLACVFFLSGCGRELELEPRRTLSLDDIVQRYQVTVFLTAEGVKSYTATATFFGGTGADVPSIDLPAGDTITLNGAAMTAPATQAGAFYASRSANSGTFAFVWTHEGRAFANTLTATTSAPPTTPTSISKSGNAEVEISALPVGATVSATVNSGNTIAEPFFALPVRVSGGSAVSPGTPDLRGLATGAGVLTILEVTTSNLQNPTAAGGSGTVTAQFGYNITVVE